MLAADQLIQWTIDEALRRTRRQTQRNQALEHISSGGGKTGMSLATGRASQPRVHAPWRFKMSAISVTDLEYDRELDHKAMASIGGGGGAPWIYGWIAPFSSQQGGGGGVGVVNIYDITNNFNADQMINQFQSVDVHNSGANSNINVSPNAIAGNSKA
jgi:hypothetical protein